VTVQLWPLSRDALPKQFLPLVGERSTYKETLLRPEPDVCPACRDHRPNFHFFARRQAEEVGVRANRFAHRSAAFTASQIGVPFFWN